MYGTLLFPTDGSEGASAAFGHVLDVAEARDATVHVLHVADTTNAGVRLGDATADGLVAAGETVVDETADRARERGVSVVTAVVRGEPYAEIVDYADAEAVDTVVMPTRGRRGLGRLLLGSTTERVVRRSNVPVLTIRPDAAVDYPYRTVLVPTDGSDCADEALARGVDVANGSGAALHLLSVVDVASLGVDVRTDIQSASLEASAEAVLDEASAFAEERGVDPTTAMEYGSSIHRTVDSYVEEHDVDLVVVGTHGRTGFDRYMLGSVTEALVRTAPVPVLTVRAPVDGDADAADAGTEAADPDGR
ncbi:universal stress protein [Candidatus Halobonum tyrrellensis]|nr:universal stress protein [Candidatus Halobonum tyrrellensis]